MQNQGESVLKLRQEFETARQTAIAALLGEIKTASEGLRALGHEPDTKGRPVGKRTRKPCSRCQATDHDARFHRGEGKKAPPAND